MLQTRLILALKAERTLSIQDDTVPVLSAQINISVMEARMQTDDSGLIWLKQPSNEVKVSQANS